MSGSPASADTMLDLLIAQGVIPSPEACAEEYASLFERAEIGLRCQIREAHARGPSWGFLVCEQSAIEPEGDVVTLARLAAMEPGDVWVELLPLTDLAEQVRPNPGGSGLARAVLRPVAPGHVRLVLAGSCGLGSIDVTIQPLEHEA